MVWNFFLVLTFWLWQNLNVSRIINLQCTAVCLINLFLYIYNLKKLSNGGNVQRSAMSHENFNLTTWELFSNIFSQIVVNYFKKIFHLLVKTSFSLISYFSSIFFEKLFQFILIFLICKLFQLFQKILNFFKNKLNFFVQTLFKCSTFQLLQTSTLPMPSSSYNFLQLSTTFTIFKIFTIFTIFAIFTIFTIFNLNQGLTVLKLPSLKASKFHNFLAFQKK